VKNKVSGKVWKLITLHAIEYFAGYSFPRIMRIFICFAVDKLPEKFLLLRSKYLEPAIIISTIQYAVEENINAARSSDME